jgi:hypothetical protein
VPVGGGYGQTAERQIDALAEMGTALGGALGMPVRALWTMRNGYALANPAGLDAIARHLAALAPEGLDALRGRVRIGLHRDVEVTDGAAVGAGRVLVSQAFCSALPVAYTRVPPQQWAPFALLVLDAAYEATLWAAVLSASRGASNVVHLTLLGGGAFGNEPAWIHAALRRALRIAAAYALDVKLVTYGPPAPKILAIAEEFG